MDPFEEFFGDPSENILIQRFERMMASKEYCFFDVEDLEELFDYYSLLRKLDFAFEVVEVAKQQHPYSPIFKIREAELHILKSDFKTALKILNLIEPEVSSFPEFFLAKAQIFSKQKLHHKAIYNLRKAINCGGEDQENVHIQLAHEYFNIDELAKAKKELKRFIRKSEYPDDALFEVSNFFEFNDLSADVISFILSYIDENPYSSVAWYNLGNLFASANQYEKALEAFDYAAVCDDDFSSAYFNKANILAKLDRHAEAIETYKLTLEYEEPSALTFYYIGECYESLEEYNEAYKHYYKAIKCDPGYADAWIGIGISLDNLNRLSEGIHYIKKALSIDPENSDYWYVLAEIERKLGFLDEAKFAFEKVIELNEFNSEVYLDYSGMYYLNEMFNEALDVISRGIRVHPSDPDLYYRMCAYLFKMNYNSDAEDILRTVLDMDPEGLEKMFEYLPELKKNERIQNILNERSS